MLSRHFILLSLPLILSAFTHLWNPIGFPFPNVDEGIYLGRAVNFMDTLNPKDPYIGYDHPYFGPIFLAGYLYATGYQGFLNFDNSINYEMSLLSPRILMGLLAILDTFLLFKIVEYRYTTKTAFIASMLFAVTPITWLTRWVLLDSIQLPFILLSILFSILPLSTENVYSSRKNILIVTLSGVFLGLSVFTKAPSFTLIPLIGYSVFKQNKNSFKILMIWLVPVLFIPSIWVIHAISMGEFGEWLGAIYNQTHRESRSLYIAINDFFTIDALLLSIGIPSLAYALIKRDLFIILSIAPLLIFMYFIGYVVVFHLIFFAVIICVSIGILFSDILSFVGRKSQVLHYGTAAGFAAIMILGLVDTTQQISTDLNSQYFKAAGFIDNYLETDQRNKDDLSVNYTGRTSVISHPFFFWVDKYKFHDKGYYYWSVPKFENQQVISIIDGLFREVLEQKNNIDGKKFRNLFSSFNTTELVSFSNNSVQGAKIDILLTDLNKYNKSTLKLTKLLDDGQEWVGSKHTHLQRVNGTMNIAFDNTEQEIKGKADLKNIIHLPGPNAYLSVKYLIPSHSKDSTFILEINDAETNLKIWRQNLKESQGKTVYQFFILPENAFGKKITLSITNHDYKKKVDSITLKELLLYY